MLGCLRRSLSVFGGGLSRLSALFGRLSAGLCCLSGRLGSLRRGLRQFGLGGGFDRLADGGGDQVEIVAGNDLRVRVYAGRDLHRKAERGQPVCRLA